MKRVLVSAGLTALAVALAACGSNDGASGNATEAGAADHGNQMADPNNPFAQAEMQMNEKMMAAVGSDAGQNWAKKMIEHHQGAIDMSRIFLDQGASGDPATIARETIEKQQKDIEDIRKLVTDGAPDPRSAELYRPAMMQMHEKMMAAKGADVAETFMRKMLEHHKGAVAISDVALKNGVTGALREQVKKTRDDNRKDIAMIEAMLGGQSHQQAMAASGAKSAKQAKIEPAPAEKAAASAIEKPKSPSKPAPATAKTDGPEPTCAPEHRAAGHC